MSLPRIARPLPPVLVLAVSVLLASCDHAPEISGKDYRGPLYPDPTSPANVLHILRQSYVERDIDNYGRVFASDFVFLADPQDAGPPGAPLPPAWGFAEERKSAQTMFQSDLVDKIELSFEISEAVELPDSLARVELTNVRLELDVRDAEGRPSHHGFAGGTDTFYFRKYPLETRNGRPVWRITRWEDKGTAPWWRIKAEYL